MNIKFLHGIACFFLLLLLQDPSFGQADRKQRFKGALCAGLTASQIDGDYSAGYNKIGFKAGATATVILGNRSDISMELSFAQRGSQNQLVQNADVAQFSLTMNYIEVPVLWHYYDWYVYESEEERDNGFYKVSFDAGLYFGRLNGTRLKDDLTAIALAIPYLNKNDLGIMVGATFYANRHLGFAFRFQRSLQLVYDPTKWNPAPLERAWNAHSLTFQTSYTF